MNRAALIFAYVVAAVVAPAALSASPTALPLSQRMLHTGELRGFAAETPTYTSNPADWAHSCAGGAARVRTDGFVASAAEHLKSQLRGRDSVSLVARFRTTRGAVDDVSAFVSRHAECSNTKITVRPVPGIVGAHSIDAHQSDGEGYDVVFADGRFSYDVGAFTADRAGPPTLADVVAAARHLYARVHGHPAV